MTRKTHEIIAEGISEESGTARLLDELEKTNNSASRQVVKEELKSRTTCPECGEELMLDNQEKELYCPVGCHSHQYEL